MASFSEATFMPLRGRTHCPRRGHLASVACGTAAAGKVPDVPLNQGQEQHRGERPGCARRGAPKPQPGHLWLPSSAQPHRKDSNKGVYRCHLPGSLRLSGNEGPFAGWGLTAPTLAAPTPATLHSTGHRAGGSVLSVTEEPGHHRAQGGPPAVQVHLTCRLESNSVLLALVHLP